MMLFNACSNLNHLTVEEYAVIGASLRYSYEEKYQCFNMSKFKTDNSLKTHKLRNSCDTIIKNKQAFHKFDYINYKTCFCNFYNPQINNLIRISDNIKEFGELPKYLIKETEISNKLLEAHLTIQTYINEFKEIQMQKQMDSIKNRK